MKQNNVEIFRLLVIGLQVIISVLLGVVSYRYHKVIHESRGKNKIPLFVWTMMTSYVLFMVYTCISIISRIGQPLKSFTLIALVAAILGIISLWFKNTELKDEIDKRF